MRAQFLKEEGKKPVCHGVSSGIRRTRHNCGTGCAQAGENRCNLLLHCRDINTEHSRNGSHCSPISSRITVNVLSKEASAGQAGA
jgi:hypothetical protein